MSQSQRELHLQRVLVDGMLPLPVLHTSHLHPLCLPLCSSPCPWCLLFCAPSGFALERKEIQMWVGCHELTTRVLRLTIGADAAVQGEVSDTNLLQHDQRGFDLEVQLTLVCGFGSEQP